MSILFTDGLGFIGSYAIASLHESGREVVFLDNLFNSQESAHQKLELLGGKPIPFAKGDVRDSGLLGEIFSGHAISASMHFAGLKSATESVENPIKDYDNNISGSIALLDAMEKHNVYQLIFSSSAIVNVLPNYLPDDESYTTNSYGQTKLQVENILSIFAKSDDHWVIACLHFFNPVGAHLSALIGGLSHDQPNKLMLSITQVASKKRSYLAAYGDDYDTKDGAGGLDYIHVMHLAEGHAATLKLIENQARVHIINLGAGQCYSVLEMISTFEKSTGQSIPVQIGKRRDGDLLIYYASADKVKPVFGLQAKLSLNEMRESSCTFQEKLQELQGVGS